MVAVNYSGDNFEIGIDIYVDKTPRVCVKLFFYGKTEEPLIHLNNLGLLFTDARKPCKTAVIHENAIRKEATELNAKILSQMPLKIWQEERRKSQKQHEDQISPGVNFGHPDI